jgi:TRAP-type C4-dicarboxylate transport system permease small subunit
MSERSGSDERTHPIERAIFKTLRFIMGALVLLIVFVAGANVVARYAFLAPFFWAEEVLVFAMIGFVYVGVILVTWDGRHLKMDILSQLLKSPWKEAVNLVTALLFVGVGGFMAVQSIKVTMTQFEYGGRSIAADIPMVIPHSLVFVGFLFMTVIAIVRFRAFVRGDVGSDRDEFVDDAHATTKSPGLGDGI